MMKNHKLARAISDASWSEFFRQLAYKAELHGAEVLRVDTLETLRKLTRNALDQTGLKAIIDKEENRPGRLNTWLISIIETVLKYKG